MQPVLPFLADTSGPFEQLRGTEHIASTLQGWIRERKDVIRTIKRQAIGYNNPFNVTYEHVKQLEADIRGFKRLLQSNDASRDHWRRVHMAAWRRTVSPLKVIDLPNEILTMIFANLQDAAVAPIRTKGVTVDEPLPIPDVASIQSVRLTCRVFCDLGSRFLLPVVNIAFTPASLQRLEDISLHSTIPNGVRVLRLHANPQRATLAVDEIRFRQEVTTRLSWILCKLSLSMERVIRGLDEAHRLMGLSYLPASLRNYAEILDLAAMERDNHEAMRSLEDPREPPPRSFQSQVKGSFAQAHREYGRRYLEQENLMRDSQVFVNIAAAVNRMPSVQRLCIPSLGWDHMFKSGWDNRYDVQKLKNWNMDIDYFLNVMGNNVGKESSMQSRCEHFGRSWTQPLLLKLPSVLQAANRNLTDLDIDLPLIDGADMEDLVAKIPDIQRSCRNLKYAGITVTNACSRVGLPLDQIYTILDAILSSPILEAATISFSAENEVWINDKTTTIGYVLKHLPCDSLRCLCLDGFPLKLEELRKFFNRVSGQIHLELGGTYLIEGTWDEALEILRGRVDLTSRVVNPQGAQLDTMSPREARDLRSEFDSEHRDGFYSFQRCPGPASFYIRGGNIPNPLIPGSG